MYYIVESITEYGKQKIAMNKEGWEYMRKHIPTAILLEITDESGLKKHYKNGKLYTNHRRLWDRQNVGNETTN